MDADHFHERILCAAPARFEPGPDSSSIPIQSPANLDAVPTPSREYAGSLQFDWYSAAC